MQTKLEDAPSTFEVFLNLIQSIQLIKDEDEILDSIAKFITTYDLDIFLKYASAPLYKMQFTHKTVEVDATFSMLHIAVMKNHNKIVSFLLDNGVDTTGLSISENKHFDKLPAWKLGILSDNKAIACLLLLDINMEKYLDVGASATDEIQTLIEEGFKSYSESIKSFADTEAIDHLLDLAKEKKLIPQLLSTKNKRGFTFIEVFAKQTTPYSLKKLIQLEDWFIYTNLAGLLHKTRISSWNYPDHYEAFNELCLKIREQPLYKDQIDKPLTLELHGDSVSMEDAYDSLFEEDCNPITNKSDALKYMIAQTTALLFSPEKCLKYLQFLDKELLRYYSETYNKPFPQINHDDYEIEIIDGVFFPIPKEDYKGCHKNNALDKLLIDIFKKYGLAELSYQWIGFITKSVSLPMLKQSYYVKEHKYGGGLFHGTLAHMLQQVIMIYAIEHREIDLSYEINTKKYNISVKEFLAAFLEIKQADSQLAWMSSRDIRCPCVITFSDPFQLTSVIMHQGREFELPTLSASLIDSFCKNFNKVFAGYKEILPLIEFDKKIWLEQLKDLRIFLLQIPDPLYDKVIKQVIAKLQADKELLHPLIQGKKHRYAAIPLKYPQDNPGFEPLQYNKNTSLFFTQKVSQKPDEVTELMLSTANFTQ